MEPAFIVGRPAALAHRRRGAVLVFTVAALLMLALILSGCSAATSGLGGGFGGGGAEGVADGGDGEGEDRSVVVEGSMSVEVGDVASASTRAQEIVAAAGGRVESRDEASSDRGAWASLALRVPADALDGVVDDLRRLGAVDHVTTTSSDVTNAVRDVDARIAAIESTLERLESFQSSAISVKELLEIEREMSDRQAELERLSAEQAGLSDRVAYSALTLELRPDGSAAPAPDSFWGGLGMGWNALVVFGSGFLVVAGAILPWAIVFGGIALLVVWIVRATRRRRALRTPRDVGDASA